MCFSLKNSIKLCDTKYLITYDSDCTYDYRIIDNLIDQIIAQKQDIINVIAKALEVEGLTIKSSVNNIDEWDSLGHLSILVALDKEFDGKLASISDKATADSIEKIILILEKNNLI